MSDKLFSLWGVIISVIFLAGVLAAFLLIFRLLRNKGGKIGVGVGNKKLEIEINKDAETAKETSTKLDTDCYKRKCDPEKYIPIITHLSGLFFDMFRLDSLTLKDQVDFVRERLLILRENDLDIYRQLVLGKNITDKDLVKNAYKSYISTTYLVYNELLFRYEKSCLENHFLQKDATEWEEYKLTKVEYFIAGMNRDFEMAYVPILDIFVDEIKCHLRDSFRPKLMKELCGILDGCKKISHNTVDMKFDIEHEIQKYHEKQCGVKDET